MYMWTDSAYVKPLFCQSRTNAEGLPNAVNTKKQNHIKILDKTPKIFVLFKEVASLNINNSAHRKILF